MNTWSMNLQDSNSPVCDMMIFFHDFTMMNLIFITLVVLLMLIFIMHNKFINRFLLKSYTTEMIWTIFPMFILIYIAMPSIKILYITDEMYINNVTIKVTGHQWYWSYEYSNFHMIKFDSFMIQSIDLKISEFRLLEVDNRCVLPFNYPIQILTTSSDVIHAWTVPSLGIKMDSTPGRLNQTNLFMNRPGLFFGQCSEICGLNHSFMPIVIESTNLMNFKNWLIYMNNNKF